VAAGSAQGVKILLLKKANVTQSVREAAKLKGNKETEKEISKS